MSNRLSVAPGQHFPEKSELGGAPSSRLLSLAPTGLDASKRASGDADGKHVTTAIQNEEQSTKMSKRLNVAPGQRFAEKSDVGGPQDGSSVSQKDQCSTLAISEKDKADEELTRVVERKGSCDYEETYVMPGPPSHRKQSVDRGEVRASTALKENYENEQSAKVEVSSQDVPPKREDDDDADKAKSSSAQYAPDAKDDVSDRQGSEETAKESAEQSAKESAEQIGEGNDKHDDVDEAAPLGEAPLECDDEGDNGSGEPPGLLEAAGTTPAAEIRKQDPERFSCTLYGIISILDVTIGVLHGHADRTIELTYPRHLLIEGDYANAEVLETFRSAVIEAAEEFGWSSETDNLISQVISVAQNLADIIMDDRSNWEVLVWKFDEFIDSNRDIGLFLRSVLERDAFADPAVVLRNSRPIERLQQFASTASVAAFVNYLCFRVVVYFSPLMDHDRTTHLRRLAGSEIAGRVLTEDKEWLLCLRMVESTQPACLSRALTMQQVAAGAYAPSRIWIGRLEDQFYRNLPRLAWMTEMSVNVFNNVIRKFRVARFFGASIFDDDHCPRPRPSEIRGSSTIGLFVRFAAKYQLWRLRQIGRPTRPRDYGHVFDMRSRYNVAQQAVYLPVGLVGDSLPANSTLPVYHASRTALRLYLGLLPLVYERWDSNENTEALELRLPADYVEIRPSEARYPILAQSAALALAYAAFKELLSVERVWKVDFRLLSLVDVTSEQLFFLFYALDNCERSDKPYRSHQFKAWQVLPPEYRVNIPLRHLPQFAQAFQCNASSGNSWHRRLPPMVAPEESRCDTVRWNVRPSPNSRSQRAGPSCRYTVRVSRWHRRRSVDNRCEWRRRAFARFWNNACDFEAGSLKQAGCCIALFLRHFRIFAELLQF
ncbi:hypothetical protein MTO96_000362 [Rhipicephalus appendiculatus]